MAELTQHLEELEGSRRALLAHRMDEEQSVSGMESIESQELLRRHEHLEKIGRDLAALEASILNKKREVEERERVWIECRREVKSLQTLVERRDAELAKDEKRRLQKTMDAVALRKSMAGRNA